MDAVAVVLRLGPGRQLLGEAGIVRPIPLAQDALFRAYFVDGENIGRTDTLVAVAEASGFDGEAARKALDERRFRDEVDRDWASPTQRTT